MGGEGILKIGIFFINDISRIAIDYGLADWHTWKNSGLVISGMT
jgi:hypothetical protein